MAANPSPDTWDASLYGSRHSFVYEHGEALADLVDVRPGDRILDLGCGTGQLTARLAERGAEVLGIDLSPSMIEVACSAYPELAFEVRDILSLQARDSFDVVFSNATLHWVKPAEPAAARIADALKPGGRLIAEFGGSGNVGVVVSSLERALEQLGVAGSAFENPWFNPTLAEYVGLLSRAGLRTEFAHLFRRPTQLEGSEGLQRWLEMFARPYIAGLSNSEISAAIDQAVKIARPDLFRGGSWYADYVRLRVIAVKPPADDRQTALGSLPPGEAFGEGTFESDPD